MQNQNEIIIPQPLLDDNGNIVEPGYAKSMLWQYDRTKVKAKRSRIKEWNYYCIMNKDFALNITLADMGYVGALSVSVVDFVTPAQFSNTKIRLFTMGKLNMPATIDSGDFQWKKGKSWMNVTCDGTSTHLVGEFPNADDRGTTLKWDVTLTDFPKEYMAIATPFNKDKHFYLNGKMNCMSCQGALYLNDVECPFNNDDSMAVLDWGRGVWTYKNTWYWASLSTKLADGKTFGFNFGYGFGNTENATEDMLFYDGKASKLPCQVTFNIPGDDVGNPRYIEPWTFKSEDGRVDLTFTPIIDKHKPFDIKVLCMMGHQVFGLYSGKCVLDDGTVIEIQDELGFAEKVLNKW